LNFILIIVQAYVCTHDVIAHFTDATSATFSGNDYIQYELKQGTTIGSSGRVFRRQIGRVSFLELEISLAFRANKNKGVILEMTGRNEFAVLKVSINYGITHSY